MSNESQISLYPEFPQKRYCEGKLNSLINELQGLRNRVLSREEGDDFFFFNISILDNIESQIEMAQKFVVGYMKRDKGVKDE